MHNHARYLVIGDHASTLEVCRENGLIHAVLLKALGIFLLGAVAREVEEEHVARTSVTNEPVQGSSNVGAGRVLMPTVVHENSNVGIFESEAPKQGAHGHHICVATTQLCTSPNVVDANKDRSLSPCQPSGLTCWRGVCRRCTPTAPRLAWGRTARDGGDVFSSTHAAIRSRLGTRRTARSGNDLENASTSVTLDGNWRWLPWGMLRWISWWLLVWVGWWLLLWISRWLVLWKRRWLLLWIRIRLLWRF
mmetsp:Transcript_43772/g.94984  ORF Transcript_43772/g.94984 Transcript_43772/m.94984 type:complete len:249 (+) Transcript_43772:597-1343(+)